MMSGELSVTKKAVSNAYLPSKNPLDGWWFLYRIPGLLESQSLLKGHEADGSREFRTSDFWTWRIHFCYFKDPKPSMNFSMNDTKSQLQNVFEDHK